MRRKFGDTTDKLHREQETSIKLSMAKSNKKYQDVRIKMIVVSTKLKDQRMIWRKHLSDFDASSKKRISNERERRRCSIQQQLDKSSDVEDQFMEIINGLEDMNDQLAVSNTIYHWNFVCHALQRRAYKYSFIGLCSSMPCPRPNCQQ